MKKIFLITILMALVTNISFSTPGYEYGLDTDEILIPNQSILPMQFAAIKEYVFEKHPKSTSRPRGNNPRSVPEPATMLLFGSGLIGLAYISRKK